MKEADYRIVADGADITSMIRKRLIKLTVQDSAGEASDTVAVVESTFVIGAGGPPNLGNP